MARNTKEDALITRQLLLDAAEALFATHGVSSVSLSQIAGRAGVTRGALYGHFDNKTALLAALYDRAYMPIAAHIAAFGEQVENGCGLEEICAFCLQLARFPFQDVQRTQFFKIFLMRSEQTEKNPVTARFWQSVADVTSLLRRALCNAIETGDLPAMLDSHQCTLYIRSQILGAVTMLLDEASPACSLAVAQRSVLAALTALSCAPVVCVLSTVSSRGMG